MVRHEASSNKSSCISGSSNPSYSNSSRISLVAVIVVADPVLVVVRILVYTCLYIYDSRQSSGISSCAASNSSCVGNSICDKSCTNSIISSVQ